MPKPDFRAALQQPADAVDGWETEPAADGPLAMAMDRAREVLEAADEGERLSSGKLVSELLDELLTEAEQRNVEPTEIILGSRAFQLYCKERYMHAGGSTKSHGDYYYLPVIRSDSEASEYVAIECEQ
jgi:hypothetical protein